MSEPIKLCALGIGCIAYESCDDGQCVVREAIAEEREACAKIIEELLRVANTHRNVGRDEETFAVSAIAKIRARGQTT